MTITSADHRYLQVARALRKEIVDGVYGELALEVPPRFKLPLAHGSVRRSEPLRVA